MRTTIDKAGRLVLPKQARDQLGLKPGDTLEIEMTGGGLSLKPLSESPRLVKKGKVLVHVGSLLDARDAAKDFVRESRDARTAELLRRAMQS